MAPVQSQYWCFTINNYSEEDIQACHDVSETTNCTYLIFGKETGETGTPHLQGFVIFDGRKRIRTVRTALGGRAHCEVARGTPYQAAEYCKKDGDYHEFGEPPINRVQRRGSAGLFADFVTWVNEFYAEHGRAPNDRDRACAFPALFVRYNRALSELTTHLLPPPEMQEGELRDWQITLNTRLHEPPDDRTIDFYVDEDGGKGKSFFQRWFLSNNHLKTQLLSIGKRDDLAHAIDVSKSVFLFNIPRGGMEHLQYTILEQLKDKVIFSPKYNSTTKLIGHMTHVVVFCNEWPDENKMSNDRFNIIKL